MLVRFIALCLALLCASGTASAQSGCRDTAGSARAPIAYATPITIKTSNGLFQVKEAYRRVSCRDRTNLLNGLVDVAGKLLVPANYHTAMAISETRALVAREPPRGQLMPTDWYYYEFGKGEVSRARNYYSSGYIRSTRGPVEYYIPFAFTLAGELPDTRSPSGKALIFDYYVYFSASPTPRHYARVGGVASLTGSSPPIERVNDLLVVQLPDSDGAPRSRLLNLEGEPISPVIGRVLAVTTYKPGPAEFPHFDNPANFISRDLVTAAFSAEHPDLPFNDLYVPLARDGTPRQLPAGALGVMPLLARVTPQGQPGWGTENRTYGWAVVFPAPAGGVELSYGLGSLDSVLAAAPNAPRISGMKRFYSRDVGGMQQDIIAIRSRADGLWRPHRAMDLEVLPETDRFATRTPDQAYNLFIDSRIARMRQSQFEYEQRKADGEARHYAASDVTFKEMLASGTMCANPSRALELHVPAIDYVLTHCDVYSGWFIERARAQGASPDALRLNETKLNSRRAIETANAVEVERKARESELANTRNWNLWTQQVTRSVDASTDSFMAGQRKTYYENLERWNRGQQNWGGPAN
jgi:hypothetical protein